jgi:hypothetical protein
METIWMRIREASFTVEAVFIMSITIWLLLSVCYLTMYAHDQTVIVSLLHQSVDNTQEKGVEPISSGNKQEMETLNSQLVLMQIQSLQIKKKILSVEVKANVKINVSFPLLERIWNGKEGKTITISHENISAPLYLWNCEIGKEIVKGDAGH